MIFNKKTSCLNRIPVQGSLVGNAASVSPTGPLFEPTSGYNLIGFLVSAQCLQVRLWITAKALGKLAAELHGLKIDNFTYKLCLSDPDPSLARISSACLKEERKPTLSPDQSWYSSLSSKASGQGKRIKRWVCLFAFNLNNDQNSRKKL